MKEKQVRACRTCNKPGHNSRTCPDNKSLEKQQARAETTPAQTAVKEMVESTPTSAPSVDSLPIELPNSAEEVGFSENIIQEYINGISMRLAYREYQNGGVAVRFRISTDSSNSKEIQLDINSAAKLLQMLTLMLQRHYVSEHKKQAIAKQPEPFVDYLPPDVNFAAAEGAV